MELTRFQRWFPNVALRRAVAQAKILAVKESTEKRYYNAGMPSPYRRPVGADVSPQGATGAGAEQMRRYARNLDENNDIAIGILDTLVNNVIGTGLPIQPLIKNMDGSLAIDANMQMAKILAEWSKRPTACRQESFASAQRLICRSWLRDGEILVNKLMGNVSSFRHGSAIPYSLELLESDYLPYLFNETEPRLIIQGIQMTAYYEPLAYWLNQVHPGDVWNAAPQVYTNESDYRRVPAEQIIHLKFTRRVNQVRGVSLLHGVIRRLEDIADYTESECIAARVASALTGYIKKSPDAVTAINTETGERDLEMTPGMIFDNLLPGEDVGTIASNRPNTEVNTFTGDLLKRVAGGTMTNYSTIARDYDGSYSSQRQGMVEAKPNYDILRDYFCERFIKPVYSDLVDLALASQELILPAEVDLDTVHQTAVANVPMPWVDPKKEVEADILRIDAKLSSRSQVISERNGDPVVVAKQIENDELLFGPDEVMPDEPETETGEPEDETAGAEADENAEA